MISQNCSASRKILDHKGSLTSKETIRSYFEFILNLKGDANLDQKDILTTVKGLDFVQCAERFKMIDSGDFLIYISNEESSGLLSKLKKEGPSKQLIRQLGRYAVTTFEKQFRFLLENGRLEIISDNAGILSDSSLYDSELGLVLDNTAKA